MSRGSWLTDPQPKLKYSRKEYNRHFVFGFEYVNFKFICELLSCKKDNSCIWFIYPHEKEFKENFLVFTDKISQNIYRQTDIYNCNINKKLYRLFQNFTSDKIFFANDLCGTDFKAVVNFTIKK